MNTVFRNGRTLRGEPIAFGVQDGRFAAVGPEIALPGAIDLEGATVLPGFVDAHCHIMPTGFDLSRLHLGPCESSQDVLDLVRSRVDEVPPGEWLLAVHYDQNKFEGLRHLHRDELDAVTGNTPTLLRHVNGHASVANSAALRAAGVDDATTDPKGGTYVRDASGRLTGVLLERAHEHVSDCAPAPSFEQRVQAAMLAAGEMSKLGVTCATDMMTGYSDLLGEMAAYSEAARRGAKVRFRLFLQWSPVFGPRSADAQEREHIQANMDPLRCRVAGAKIFADGALSAGTAAIHGTFTSGGNGKLIYDPSRLNEMVLTAHEAGWRVSIHSIGDRSTDIVMDAFEQTGDCKPHRLEHAMILSDEQIARIANSGVHVTMQPEFLLRLGHAYFRQLSPETATRLKRARSCLDAGIPLSFNSDRPIVAGNPWDGIKSAVRRPDGFDQAENVTLEEAVGLYTFGGALANGDVGDMGEIAPGKLADFQVYANGIDVERPVPDSVYLGGVPVSGEGSYRTEHAGGASR